MYRSWLDFQTGQREQKKTKVLSILTTVFLPVTFVGSSMGLPFFNWRAQDIREVVNVRVWIYVLAVTLVTLLVHGIWFVWLRMRVVALWEDPEQWIFGREKVIETV